MFDNLLEDNLENNNGLNRNSSPVSGDINRQSNFNNPTASPVAPSGPAGAEDIFSNLDTGPEKTERPPVFQPKPFSNTPNDYEFDSKLDLSKKAIILLGVVIVFLLIGYGVWFVNKKFFTQLAPDASLDTQQTNDTPVTETENQTNITNLPEIKPTVTEANTGKVATPLDNDKDGLTDEEENLLGTDINNVDSDADGLFDRDEVKVYKTNPLNPDTDGDGFKDGDEVKSGNNPNGPGKLFQINQQAGEQTAPETKITEPAKTTDSDNDGLTDEEEKILGTNPNKADTDSDGLSDFDEENKYKTNPLRPDTDGDGFNDGAEVKNGYNPNGQGKLN